jgi:hypothetical protein
VLPLLDGIPGATFVLDSPTSKLTACAALLHIVDELENLRRIRIDDT